MKHSTALSSALLLVSSLTTGVLGHARVKSPAIRVPGPKHQAVCGQKSFDVLSADATGHIEEQEPVATDACELTLCRGMLFADQPASNVQQVSPGQNMSMSIDCTIPHGGPANVTLIDTTVGGTGKVIGSDLKTFADFCPSGATPADQSNLQFTLPDASTIGSSCGKAGECVVQLYWATADGSQTYYYCVDVAISGGASESTTTVQTSTVATSSSVETVTETSTSVVDTATTTTDTSSVETTSTTTQDTSTSVQTSTIATVTTSSGVDCGPATVTVTMTETLSVETSAATSTSMQESSSSIMTDSASTTSVMVDTASTSTVMSDGASASTDASDSASVTPTAAPDEIPLASSVGSGAYSSQFTSASSGDQISVLMPAINVAAASPSAASSSPDKSSYSYGGGSSDASNAAPLIAAPVWGMVFVLGAMLLH